MINLLYDKRFFKVYCCSLSWFALQFLSHIVNNSPPQHNIILYVNQDVVGMICPILKKNFQWLPTFLQENS